MNIVDERALESMLHICQMLGFGDQYGLLGNNNAHFGDLLCDGRNGHEIDDRKIRDCSLNEHDLICVRRLERNNNEALQLGKDMYKQLCSYVRLMHETIGVESA